MPPLGGAIGEAREPAEARDPVEATLSESSDSATLRLALALPLEEPLGLGTDALSNSAAAAALNAAAFSSSRLRIAANRFSRNSEGLQTARTEYQATGEASARSGQHGLSRQKPVSHKSTLK